MDRRYKHLSSEERGVILAEHRRGSTNRAIGLLLGRTPSTIRRELARGRMEDASYSPQAARGVYDARRLRCKRGRKLAGEGGLHAFVRDRLIHSRWSPEQIAGRLRVEPVVRHWFENHWRGHPDNPAARVSPEMIYAHPKGALKAAMTLALRQAKPARGCRRTTLAGSSMVPESLRIIHRPEDIEARLVPGHWEGDLIKGAFNRSSVGTLVERKTRFVVLCKMDGNTALAAFTRQMKRLPRELRRSMTYDRGSEMACHPELARRLKIDICISRPPRALAARIKREHQRFAAPVHAQRHRPRRCVSGLAQRRSPVDERAPPQDPRLENPRRSHGRRNRGLPINRCT